MLSVVLGCIFVISAVSGRMILLGPDGSQWLMYTGLSLVTFGSFRLASQRSRARVAEA